MSRRTSRSTSYTSGVSPVGPFRAKVVGVSGGLASIQIPRLGLNNVYEDVPYSGFVPSAGTDVWAFFIEGNPSRPMIIVSAEDSLSDINEIVAGTNLNGGGTGGSVTLNLDDDITLSTVTADEFYGDLHGAIHLQVKNVDSVALSHGDPVYATGAVGASGAIEVQGSSAGSAGTMPAMGLLDQDLAVNGEGDVVVSGVLQRFDTDTPGYSVGDELYVAPSGGLTTTRPTGSSELVQKIGKVIRVQQNTGEILVQGAGRTNDVPNSFTTSGDVTVGGDLTVDTDTLHVDATNDRVGIGTTSPAVDLQVSKIGTGSSEPTVRLENLNGNQLDMKVNASEAYVGTPSSIPLNLGTQGQDFVTIGTTGNVGIGKSSPTYKLDIDAVSDGNILRLKGADDTLNFTVSAGDYSILNSQQSNGIVIYDGTGGVEIFYNGSAVFEADSGGVKVGGSRILTVADEGTGNGLDADTVDGVHASGFVSTTYNSSLNSDSRNSRGPTRLYRRDNNSDYSVQTYWTGSRWRLYGYAGDTGHADTHVGYADNADTTDGLHVHGGRNNEANKIVRTDGNGYIQAGWINTTSGATGSTIARIYASNDAYVRYVTPATFRSQIIDGYYLPLGGGTISGNLTVTGYVASASGNADPVLKVGDDAWIGDTDAVNTIAFYGNSNNDRCTLQFGRYSGATITGYSSTIDINNRLFVKNLLTTTGNNTLRYDGTSFEMLRFTSLREKKEDITSISGMLEYLNEESPIQLLNPVIFHEKDQTLDTGETHNSTRGEYIYGFIAEEVHEVIPESTSVDSEGNLVSYSNDSMVALLVAEVQRLTGLVHELYADANPDWIAPQARPAERADAEKAIYDAKAAELAAAAASESSE